ncbi:MAG: sodium:proton antiporter [Pseudomonadota bacterium]
MFQTASVLVVSSALFAWFNHRFIRLPTTIGIMVIAMLFSLVLITLGTAGFLDPVELGTDWLRQVDFKRTLMDGMLAFLLFAGALHVDLKRLVESRLIVGLLATLGVVLSTAIIAVASYAVFQAIGQPVPFLYCLLFGVIVSPTDPVAVLGILKTAGAPKSLEVKIAGESLFNDGVAVVVFIALLGIATGAGEASASAVASLFALEVIGGVALGAVTGGLCWLLLARVDDYTVEILLTLALVMGGYSLAKYLHVSGVLAMVVAGLVIGNPGRENAMSDTTQAHLDTFWELVDEILNAVLFLLMGLVMLLLSIEPEALIAGLVLALVALAARWFAVSLATRALQLKKAIHPKLVTLLTWGGIRGGISVALALSLPESPWRTLLLTATYVIVVLSILVQGLSIKRLISTVFNDDASSRESNS